MFAQLSDPHAAPMLAAAPRTGPRSLSNVDDAASTIHPPRLLRHFSEAELRAIVAFTARPRGAPAWQDRRFAAVVVPLRT
jgi:hypothetical protein